MPVDQQLSKVLGELTRTFVTDSPIQTTLDHFVSGIVEVLPVDAAGVTLISPGLAPRFIAASNDDALSFEQLQSYLNDGPSIAAYDAGEPVVIADLRDDQRFSEFSIPALHDGLMAVFTFPLRSNGERLGALDLYRMRPGRLDTETLASAQVLADVASAYIVNARLRNELHDSPG